MSGSIQTIKGADRYYKVANSTASQTGFPFLEIGPAGTTQGVSTMMIQFKPNANWNGSFVVAGRLLGTAADNANMPFVPIPYRRVMLADIAQDYAMVVDTITGSALIEVPANGLSICLVFTVGDAPGECEIASWDLQGPSAV